MKEYAKAQFYKDLLILQEEFLNQLVLSLNSKIIYNQIIYGHPYGIFINRSFYLAALILLKGRNWKMLSKGNKEYCKITFILLLTWEIFQKTI